MIPALFIGWGCVCATVGYLFGLAVREEDVWPHEPEPELDCELPPAPSKPLSLCPDYALPTADGRLIEVWL